MFQFTTTTIVNSLKDYNFPNNDLIKDIKDSSNAVVGIHIKRDFKFLAANVENIFKRAASDPELGQITIDLSAATAPTTADQVFRVALYIKLSGSQNSYYANNLLFKGKPFYIEFLWKVGETAAQVAAKVVKNAKKYQQMVYENALLEISASGATVTIDATDEYQVFSKAELQAWDQSLGLWQEGSPVGAFATLDTIDAESDNYTGTILTLVKQGKEGFGTYRNMIKDYRLPTAANTRWNKIIQDETPVVGAKYNQYTIEYCVDRGLMGGAAVGQQVKSKTTHVFFVKQDLATAFEAALAKIGTVTEIA